MPGLCPGSNLAPKGLLRPNVGRELVTSTANARLHGADSGEFLLSLRAGVAGAPTGGGYGVFGLVSSGGIRR